MNENYIDYQLLNIIVTFQGNKTTVTNYTCNTLKTNLLKNTANQK